MACERVRRLDGPRQLQPDVPRIDLRRSMKNNVKNMIQPRIDDEIFRDVLPLQISVAVVALRFEHPADFQRRRLDKRPLDISDILIHFVFSSAPLIESEYHARPVHRENHPRTSLRRKCYRYPSAR